MSITAIANSLLPILTGWQLNQPQSAQQFESQLQKLGQDLQSGNLQAAQRDFAALELDGRQAIQQGAAHHRYIHAAAPPDPASASPASSVSADFRQLAQSLQTGNLQAAQQAFSAIQADLGPMSSGAPGVNVTI